MKQNNWNLDLILHLMVKIQEAVMGSFQRDPTPKAKPNFSKLILNSAGKWPIAKSETCTNN